MRRDGFIAVEIHADGIGLAEFMRHASGSVELLDYRFSAFGASLSVEMAPEAVVAVALKRMLDEKPPSIRRASVALEGHSVFSRCVRLPPVSADQQEKTIRHEAVQNIPFPLNEVVWDYQLNEQAAGVPEVLLVAMKADLASGMVHAVRAAGLWVDVLDVAPVALANAIRYTEADRAEPTLAIDLGNQSSNLIFMDGERTFFRPLPGAGKRLDELIQETARSIDFYRNQQEGRAPARVLLTGDLHGLDDPERLFSDPLNLPVEIFDPLRKVALGPGVDAATARRAGVLVGLAVRRRLPCAVEINLVPESLRKARNFRRREPMMVLCVALVALLAGTWAVGLPYLTELTGWESSGVAARIAALEELERQLVPVERRIAELETRSRVYRIAIGHRTVWLEALLELRNRLPDGMFLVAAEPLREGAALEGLRITVVSYLDKEAAGLDAVVLLRDRLRSSDRFSKKTKVFNRPTKKRFARQFVMDVFFEEPMIR